MGAVSDRYIGEFDLIEMISKCIEIAGHKNRPLEIAVRPDVSAVELQ